MLIVTYNANSLGARLPRLLALLAEHRPDVVLLQETKCVPTAFPHAELAEVGYLAADHSGGRWAGVAVLGRADLGVDDIVCGLPGEPDVNQARWVEATVGGIRCVSVYVPNGQRIGSAAFASKLAFLEAMASRSAALRADGPTVIGGDVNVCPTDLDAYDPAALHGGTHATDDERQRMAAIVDTGYVDTFRHLYPTEPGYSWWDYRAGHFHKGFGLRIDLVLVSDDMTASISAGSIQREYRKPSRVPDSKPSDHAPLLITLDVATTPGQSATNDPVAAVAARQAGVGDKDAQQLGLL